MGEKDIAEKLLMDYNDVFADIVNVLLIPAVENKTGGATMVDVFDQIEQRGDQKGQVRVYVNELHYTPKEISIKMGLPETKINGYIKQINNEKKTRKSKA